MNRINQRKIETLGYGFIDPQYLPAGEDEYYLRRRQNPRTDYRDLSPGEIEILIANGNTSDNWKQVKIAGDLYPGLIRNCKFYGLIRIGKLEPYFLEFNNLRMAVGIYNSTIISSDIGNNVAIDNVNYLSHYIIGDDVLLANINELAGSDHPKFGNGFICEGEKEAVRIWIEVCNENAGRRILPFNGMLPGDAWLWSRFRDNDQLQAKFKSFTEDRFDKRRGYYGQIGNRTVIKNCGIIKDAWIGSDAYIKGANKLKNLTINSTPEAPSQIGEGCELVNGIIGEGCRLFYGVKAVRFVLASHSQLKYGARLINSYLGDNSTISCCEVLNSLIFPAHEQHHNNSFLCAATLMGQSNMAAGATIGSNHNSRGADGELVAGRGFWPGLCVSLKHNSRFASFTLLAKGDFPAELDIRIPFSLVSNDVTRNRLVIMPAYWFLYNMYALARNSGKYDARDKRVTRIQQLEFDYLAPDSINEILEALQLICEATGKAWQKKKEKKIATADLASTGRSLLEEGKTSNLEILLDDIECSNRKVELLKAEKAYGVFQELINFYAVSQLLHFARQQQFSSLQELLSQLPAKPVSTAWLNVGGQLIPKPEVEKLVYNICSDEINSWDSVHQFYQEQAIAYQEHKTMHAWSALLQAQQLETGDIGRAKMKSFFKKAIDTRKWMARAIYDSRAKDYENPFRKMLYESEKEMEAVIGKLEDNTFIAQQEEDTLAFSRQVAELADQLGL